MEELWSRFRSRFLESAQTRLSRARALSIDGRASAAAIAHELHALAGEASVLGLGDVAAIARAGERAAKTWSTRGDDCNGAGPCGTALDELDVAVRALSQADAP
jgi:hypothetical protein